MNGQRRGVRAVTAQAGASAKPAAEAGAPKCRERTTERALEALANGVAVRRRGGTKGHDLGTTASMGVLPKADAAADADREAETVAVRCPARAKGHAASAAAGAAAVPERMTAVRHANGAKKRAAAAANADVVRMSGAAGMVRRGKVEERAGALAAGRGVVRAGAGAAAGMRRRARAWAPVAEEAAGAVHGAAAGKGRRLPARRASGRGHPTAAPPPGSPRCPPRVPVSGSRNATAGRKPGGLRPSTTW